MESKTNIAPPYEPIHGPRSTHTLEPEHRDRMTTGIVIRFRE